MSLSHLADEVAARAFEQSIDGVAEQDRERVLIMLHHSHIPWLAEADLVEYNRSNATVTLSEAAEQTAPFLALADNRAGKPV